MANYFASARTNYFSVKDVAAFRDALKDLPVEICVGHGEASNLSRVCVLCRDEDGAGWPTQRYDDEADDYVEIDLVDLIAPHLVEGEVAVMMEAGAEKLRYIVGYAVAFDSTGESIQLSLSDIYAIAREKFGVQPTEASY
jgi:hypothetical protein